MQYPTLPRRTGRRQRIPSIHDIVVKEQNQEWQEPRLRGPRIPVRLAFRNAGRGAYPIARGDASTVVRAERDLRQLGIRVNP